MQLSAGTRIGAYEIVGLIGAGGMGEVYRARDTKLNRDVALKVLPELVAGDADRLARFRREAQVLGALNHPNIAHIYGLEDSSSSPALVMELCEGRDLSQIVTTPIAFADALPIARQMIDALEAAHEQGIIHRDLKPANIKVRDDGTVKVLDFGLAKALDPTDPAAASSVSNSPTLTARATQMGMILGTAAYMAPEQARGRAVDRRADIWAFGVVLYEMLTGKRAFEGDDVSITLASVLKEDVKWDALPADVPASIRRLLRRCLEKDPKRRLSAIGDARLELDEATNGFEAVASSPPQSGVSKKERVVWATLAAIATILAIVFALSNRAAPEADALIARFSVLPPGDGDFSGGPPRFSISPDGRTLVFAASTEVNGIDRLWLRQIDSPDVFPIAGTESGANGFSPQSPFWSPNGRRLAFFFQTDQAGAQGQSRLRTIDLQGGSPQKVCDLPANNAGGSWNEQDVMLVSSQETKGIQRVPAGGGVPTQVTTLDATRDEVAHLFPQFLPDGRHFIFQVLTKDRSNLSAYVGAIDSTERHQLVQSDYARFAAPNLLVYVKDANLLAQTLDMKTLQLTGEPTVVATGLEARAGNGRAGFAVSDTGVLAYRAEPEADRDTERPNRQLTWLDRNGKSLGTVGDPTSATTVRLAPNGVRAVTGDVFMARTAGAAGSLRVMELDRSVIAPLTPARGLAFSPVWSSDSARVLFSLRRDGDTGVLNMQIMERPANGALPPQVLLSETGFNLIPLDASRDGVLTIFSRGQGGRRRLLIHSRADGTAKPYLTGDSDTPQASLSYDNKWLAYVSNEYGARQIIVQSFPDPSKWRWQISTNGGVDPRWRRDGSELYYVDGDQRLMAVSVTPGREGLVPGKPSLLFTLPRRSPAQLLGSAYGYDAAADGQRFLVSVPLNAVQKIPLTVTMNWTALLKKK